MQGVATQQTGISHFQMQRDPARLAPTRLPRVDRPVHRAGCRVEQLGLLEIKGNTPSGKHFAPAGNQTALDPWQTAAQARHVGRRDLLLGMENLLQNLVRPQTDRAPSRPGALHAGQSGKYLLAQAGGRTDLFRAAGPDLMLPQHVQRMLAFGAQGQGFRHAGSKTAPLSLCNPSLLAKLKS